MALALPTSRIRLPDRLKNYQINPKWAQFRPKFVFFPPAGPNNLITNEKPTNPGAFPGIVVGSPGKGYSSGAVDSTCFIYDRETGNAGSSYTVFFVFEAGASIASSQNLLACGTIMGTNKPFNYRFQIDPGVTRGIRYYHDTGPTPSQNDFDLSVVLKDREPSTVSASLNGTTMHKCIDGVTGTATLSAAPADAGEGDFRVLGAAGNNTTIDGTMHLVVVFDEFIPNDIIVELHKNPADFFAPPDTSMGFVAGGAITRTKTTSLDALIKTQNNLLTTSLDALIQKTTTLQTSLDSLIQKTTTKTTSLDSLVQKQNNLKTTSLDALVQKTVTLLTSLDAVLTDGTTKFLSTSLDSLLQKTYTKTTSLDALIKDTLTLATTVDAILKKTYAKTASLDSVLGKQYVLTTAIDSVVRKNNLLLTVSLDAYLSDGQVWVVQTNNSSTWTVQ